MRGAWIEISCSRSSVILRQSLPVRGAWIEISTRKFNCQASGSLPVRGAWIEMATLADLALEYRVAPRAGSVD